MSFNADEDMVEAGFLSQPGANLVFDVEVPVAGRGPSDVPIPSVNSHETGLHLN